jgi:hypothetical protein
VLDQHTIADMAKAQPATSSRRRGKPGTRAAQFPSARARRAIYGDN